MLLGTRPGYAFSITPAIWDPSTLAYPGTVARSPVTDMDSNSGVEGTLLGVIVRVRVGGGAGDGEGVVTVAVGV